MSNNETNVKELLKNHGMYNGKVEQINFHLNVFNCDAKYLITRLSTRGFMVSSKNLTNEELAHVVFDLISKCDMKNPDYDSKLDEEMTRIGLKTDCFKVEHNRSIWNNGMFVDDGFGFGSEVTDIYDDYIDSMSGQAKMKNMKNN